MPLLARRAASATERTLVYFRMNMYIGPPTVPAPRIKAYRAAAGLGPTSEMGLVSRVAPVQTAVRNCTKDEGRPFGFGDQVADPKPPRAAAVKSRGGERRGKVGT